MSGMTPDQAEEWDGVFTPEQEALHREIEANTNALIALLDGAPTDD